MSGLNHAAHAFVEGGPGDPPNEKLWEFEDSIDKWKKEVLSITEKGGLVSPESLNSYLNEYEQLAGKDGRTYVAVQDILNANEATGNIFMVIVPVGRVIKGYTFLKTIGGKFNVFQKVVPNSYLSGEARAVYIKYFNSQGKMIKMYKDTYRIDGRFLHRRNMFPEFKDLPRYSK